MPGKIYLVYGPRTRISAIRRQAFGRHSITHQIEINKEPGEEYRGSIFTFTKPSVKKAEVILEQRAEREPLADIAKREISRQRGSCTEIPEIIRKNDRLKEMDIFVAEIIGKIEEKYGELDRQRRIDLAIGLGEMIINAKRHGNNGDPWKRIFVCHYKTENGFAIEVIDEGEGSLALIPLPEWVRAIANYFRPNYHGMNIGIEAIRVRFGRKNLSAHKLFGKDGNRVGTRVRLAVVD